VLAVSTIDYSRSLLPPLETSVDRVFVVNSAQIAQGTLNVNETLSLATRQAAALGPMLRPSDVAGRPTHSHNGATGSASGHMGAVASRSPAVGARS
jgi:hypothetical protein